MATVSVTYTRQAISSITSLCLTSRWDSRWQTLRRNLLQDINKVLWENIDLCGKVECNISQNKLYSNKGSSEYPSRLLRCRQRHSREADNQKEELCKADMLSPQKYKATASVSSNSYELLTIFSFSYAFFFFLCFLRPHDFICRTRSNIFYGSLVCIIPNTPIHTIVSGIMKICQSACF